MLGIMKQKSLRVKLLSIVLAAVLIPSAIVAVILLRDTSERERAVEFREMQAIAETVADGVGDFVSDAQAVLTTASLSHIYWESPRRALQNILSTFGYFRRVAVRDTSGKVVSLVVRGDEKWEPPAKVTNEAFTQAARGKLYTSKVQFTADSRPLLLVAVPIRQPGGEPQGVITAVISLESLLGVVDRSYFGPQSYAFLVSGEGKIIAHPSNPKLIGKDVSGLPPIKRAINGVPDTGLDRSDIYTDADGHQVATSYLRVPQLGWLVIVRQPVSRAFQGVRRAAISVIGWTLVFAALFAYVGIYLARHVSTPIARLRDAARIMGSGNLTYRVHVSTGDELEQLAQSLNEMAASLEASTKKLEKEHTRALRSAREAGTLYRVSQALVSTVHLERRLSVVAKSIAKVCETSNAAIWLIDESGSLVAAGEYGMSEEIKAVFSRTRISLPDSGLAGHDLFLRKEPVVIDDLTQQGSFLREIGSILNIRSALFVPLSFHDHAIGFVLAYETKGSAHFTGRQIRLAHAIAAQGAVAVENARAYQRERKISETLQRAFLPEVPSRVGKFEIADIYESALAEAEVGGDFYDVIHVLPGKLVIVMADVSGKGLDAAIHTAMLKYTVRAYASEHDNAVDIVSRLNETVCRYIGGQAFITLFYGLLDTETATLEYVNAGHELPLLYGESRGMCMRLTTTGTALGVVEGYRYASEEIAFVPGDVLLMYTDGATEVRRDGEFLGIEGLESMFCEVASGGARDIVRAMERRIKEYAKGVLRDDMALLVVKSL